jgi:uncharacterized damage-inducible protein DinB
MNRLLQEYYPILEQYQALRYQLMGLLSDADLAFQPGGANPTLGRLCVEIGETEQAYIDSFRTFRCDFSYRRDEPGLEGSVERLTAWYEQLDRELKEAVSALSDEDLERRVIERGPDFALTPHIQLHIYREALLIFYGKASVYLKAMGITPSEQFQDWIA